MGKPQGLILPLLMDRQPRFVALPISLTEKKIKNCSLPTIDYWIPGVERAIKSAAQAVPRVAQLWRGGWGKSVLLIVDDHDDSRIALVRLLAIEGYHAIGVSGGVAALEFLQTHTPRLAIIDYSMPEMDGLKLFAAMKRDERLAMIPVIMFSAFDEPYRTRALEAGVDAYIVKCTMDFLKIQNEIIRLAGPGLPATDHPRPPGDAKRSA
jgi:CheY-like chemotaxis protein